WQQGGVDDDKEGGGDNGVKWRVGGSGLVDRIDRRVGNLFGLCRKRWPENFSGDGGEKLSQEKVSQKEALEKFKWNIERDHEIKVLGEVNVELESGTKKLREKLIQEEDSEEEALEEFNLTLDNVFIVQNNVQQEVAGEVALYPPMHEDVAEEKEDQARGLKSPKKRWSRMKSQRKADKDPSVSLGFNKSRKVNVIKQFSGPQDLSNGGLKWQQGGVDDDKEGGGGSGVKWCVGGSGLVDRIDRRVENLLGLGRKRSPENFFGGGGVVAGGG
nr:hypothetical protein [Tanacetum cinerariifolium]